MVTSSLNKRESSVTELSLLNQQEEEFDHQFTVSVKGQHLNLHGLKSIKFYWGENEVKKKGKKKKRRHISKAFKSLSNPDNT